MSKSSAIRTLVLGCNIPGIVILIISFLVTFGYEALTGEGREGRLMMILGPSVFTFDTIYRRNIRGAKMLSAESGGTILWIPAWAMGLI